MSRCFHYVDINKGSYYADVDGNRGLVYFSKNGKLAEENGVGCTIPVVDRNLIFAKAGSNYFIDISGDNSVVKQGGPLYYRWTFDRDVRFCEDDTGKCFNTKILWGTKTSNYFVDRPAHFNSQYIYSPTVSSACIYDYLLFYCDPYIVGNSYYYFEPGKVSLLDTRPLTAKLEVSNGKLGDFSDKSLLVLINNWGPMVLIISSLLF